MGGSFKGGCVGFDDSEISWRVLLGELRTNPTVTTIALLANILTG